MDIGGTTGKTSAIVDGAVALRPDGHIFGIPVRVPMPVLRSNALGGGSIARVVDGRVTLGPESMGAAPGPACYGLGGSAATLTDALVLLGVISPTAFLEGRRVLDVGRARDALERTVATPLGVDVEVAAETVLACAVAMMAGLARETATEVGWSDWRDLELYAFGGNGPLFGTAVAETLGIERVRFFALGTVFSAYGSAISDVLHVYERALDTATTAADLVAAGATLVTQARRDLAGEGFDPATADYAWTVQDAARRRVTATGTIEAVADALLAELPAADLLRLEARVVIGQVALPVREASPATPDERASPLGTAGRLPLHAHASLPGRTVAGPCAVDGGTFTWLVGRGWTLAVDAHGDAVATREGHA